MRPRWWIVLVIVVALIALGATSLRRSSSSSRADAEKTQPAGGGGRGGRGAAGLNAPLPIVAAPVTARDVPIYLKGLGSVIAYNTVTIKSRVDGELVKINFREGEIGR